MTQQENCHDSFSANHFGFTLIELIAVIVLLSILSISIAPMFSQGLSAVSTGRESYNSLSKLRYAMYRIVNELRQINHNGSNYEISTNTTNSIVFNKNDVAATEVEISLSNNIVSLTCSIPNVASTLLDEVSSFNLAYLDLSGSPTNDMSSVIFIELSVSTLNSVTGAIYAQRTRVALRDMT